MKGLSQNSNLYYFMVLVNFVTDPFGMRLFLMFMRGKVIHMNVIAGSTYYSVKIIATYIQNTYCVKMLYFNKY